MSFFSVDATPSVALREAQKVNALLRAHTASTQALEELAKSVFDGMVLIRQCGRMDARQAQQLEVIIADIRMAVLFALHQHQEAARAALKVVTE